MASACLAALGDGRFRSYAAGAPAQAGEAIHPMALEALRKAHLPCGELRPQPWDAFLRAGAPRLDFVITLDRSVAAQLPPWPGQPQQALWEYPDLLAAGSASAPDAQQFTRVLLSLRRRLELLTNLTARQAHASDLRSDLRDIAYLP